MSEPTLSTPPIALMPMLSARLTNQPVHDLISAAMLGFRLYELFRLQDADDLLHYIDVELESETPQAFNWWHEWHHAPTPPSHFRWGLHDHFAPWRANSPEATAWLAVGGNERARTLAAPLWPDIVAARARVREIDDSLTRYELALIDRDMHPNDIALQIDELSPYLRRHFRWKPRRLYSERQYALLRDLLALPEVTAFTLRGRGDFTMIRHAVEEQARRCGAIQGEESDVFPIRVLSDWSGGGCFDPDSDERVALDWKPAWMRGVRLQSEGLQIEGLFYDEGGLGGTRYGQMEHTRLRDGVQLMLVNDLEADRTPLRDWFDVGEGWWLGTRPEITRSVEMVLPNNAVRLD
jgi:hypothetical protein